MARCAASEFAPVCFLLLLMGALLAPFGPAARAQEVVTVQGVVADSATGEMLPAANIQIAGTYQGTITNNEGRFTLALDGLPATLIVRYIGYQTVRRTISARPTALIRIALPPSTLVMEELVVTGENPAERIMRRVIARKQKWQAALRTYRADAYNRFTVANDTGIVSIVETQTKAFWTREHGMEEVLVDRRQTANLDLEAALPAALFVSNLYGDNVEVAGHTLIGVTHPDALDHYRFTLEGTRARDGQRVFDIGVMPERATASAFRGRIAVLDSAFAMIEAELRPSRAFVFPPPIRKYQLAFAQQFSNFGGAFWLPVDFRAQHRLDVQFSSLLRLPTLRIDQVSRLTNYVPNAPVPDSLFEDEGRVVIDSTALAAIEQRADAAALDVPDTLAYAGARVPLTLAEQRAFRQIDSTQTLEKAFAPQGPIGRLVRMQMEADDEAKAGASAENGEAYLAGVPIDRTLRPLLWYNRVEGLHAGAKLEIDIADRFTMAGRGGYSTAIEAPARWSYGGRVAWDLGSREQVTLSGGYTYGVDRRYRSPVYSRLANSVWTLLGQTDYFDYLGQEVWRGGLTYQLPGVDGQVGLHVRSARQFSVRRHTSYDLFGVEDRQPLNPPIEPGRLHALALRLQLGETRPQLGLFGHNRMLLEIAHSDAEWMGGDFDFTRFHVQADAHVETFFRRRFLPMALDVRLVGGTFIGTLPLQQFGIVDASWRPLSIFGALKTLPERPYQGEQYAGLFWEHSFRTVPLEVLGLHGLAERGYNILLYGGHARTWIADARQDALLQQGIPVRDSGGFHHELGVSVSGIFDSLRLDFTKRLDAPGFTVGIGLARLY